MEISGSGDLVRHMKIHNEEKPYTYVAIVRRVSWRKVS